MFLKDDKTTSGMNEEDLEETQEFKEDWYEDVYTVRDEEFNDVQIDYKSKRLGLQQLRRTKHLQKYRRWKAQRKAVAEVNSQFRGAFRGRLSDF